MEKRAFSNSTAAHTRGFVEALDAKKEKGKRRNCKAKGGRERMRKDIRELSKRKEEEKVLIGKNHFK